MSSSTTAGGEVRPPQEDGRLGQGWERWVTPVSRKEMENLKHETCGFNYQDV